MKKRNILFLCKDRSFKGDSYSNEGTYGLWNSATFVCKAMWPYYNCSVEACIDANCIDKFVTHHRPDVVVIEALWVTADKLRQLVRLHPNVYWIIRIHSKLPFLANEGIALGWCREYLNVHNVYLAGNNKNFVEHMGRAGYDCLYLPNIYTETPAARSKRPGLNIGCFGSIRPLKNTLIQAVAAISFAKSQGLKLNFHINSSRTEQKGENVLRNIISLFEHNPQANLIQHGWKSHNDFLKLVSSMDIGMQVSYSESFNIVSADFVMAGVPVVTSDEIEFVTSWLWADPNSVKDIQNKLWRAYNAPKTLSYMSQYKLRNSNSQAISDWLRVI